MLKNIVTDSPILKFFDPTKTTKISVDAGSKGMGAVLLQDQCPIACASKSLTATQQNYAQIEKEMLAIVFDCQNFHDYIYGLPNVAIETDHKPLETILQKTLHAAPARLRRMNMSIQKYPTYRPGKELLIADTLSRAPLPDKANKLEFRQYNINILHTLPITEPKLEEFKEQTKEDPALRELVHTVQNGWPTWSSTILELPQRSHLPPRNSFQRQKGHRTCLHAPRDVTTYPRISPRGGQMQAPSQRRRPLARHGCAD